MKATLLTTEEYNAYYDPYIKALGNVDLFQAFNETENEFLNLINSIPEEKLHYSYGIGKWTVAEVLLHVVDTERIFQYRALRIGRNDKTNLAGFDENLFVPESFSNERSVESLKDEFKVVRASTRLLFESFNDQVLLRNGNANNSVISVRAIGFIISGHAKHHIRIIKERYL